MNYMLSIQSDEGASPEELIERRMAALGRDDSPTKQLEPALHQALTDFTSKCSTVLDNPAVAIPAEDVDVIAVTLHQMGLLHTCSPELKAKVLARGNLSEDTFPVHEYVN